MKIIRYHAALLIAVVFIVNLVATHFYWYSSIWWFDMVMHFIGGLALSLIVFMTVTWRLRQKSAILLWTLVLVLIFALLWELYEFGLQDLFAIKTLANPLDSVSDTLLALSGACIGIMYAYTKHE